MYVYPEASNQYDRDLDSRLLRTILLSRMRYSVLLRTYPIRLLRRMYTPLDRTYVVPPRSDLVHRERNHGKHGGK